MPDSLKALSNCAPLPGLLRKTTEYDSTFGMSGPFVNGSPSSVYCGFHHGAEDIVVGLLRTAGRKFQYAESLCLVFEN
jgi:hypothetical protein